jgi:hypothetical protein
VTAAATNGFARAGGIAGYKHDGGMIENCYSSGATITATTSTISNSANAGGIAGFSASTIKNCAAANQNIMASGKYTRIRRTVGAITTAYGKITDNNYANAAMTGNYTNSFGTGDQFDPTEPPYDPHKPDATPYVDNGIDKSLTDFRNRSTYNGLGWQFGSDEEHPWKMPAGTGYPILYWQK